MGRLLRLVVFVLALCALAAGAGAMLLHERHREQQISRLFLGETAPDGALVLETVRQQHQRSRQALLLFTTLGAVCLLVLAILPVRSPATPAPVDAVLTRTEMHGIETLARTANAQRIELDHEREARHRSEQDLHLQQLLANHALQDKIRLGRDLHDGLVQNLYAAGLVLETAAQQLANRPGSPGDIARLIDRAKNTLNAAIRETRGTIGGLTPGVLEEQSFSSAVHAVLEHLEGGRLKDRRIDLAPDLPPFAEPARTELLQIIRESASNALRHGAATRLEIRLTPQPDGRVRLIVRDDGKGFDLRAVTRGHGLDNLAARTRALAATLDISSTPGRGTTITVLLPAPKPTATV
jgi:signal transduction histidine kinase